MFWNIVFILYLVAILFLLKTKIIPAAILLLLLFPIVWNLRKYGAIDRKEAEIVHVTDEQVKEAMAILEIDGDITEEKVKQAYHRLIKKMHPDQGGSKYLAEKINGAKETLLNYIEQE